MQPVRWYDKSGDMSTAMSGRFLQTDNDPTIMSNPGLKNFWKVASSQAPLTGSVSSKGGPDETFQPRQRSMARVSANMTDHMQVRLSQMSATNTCNHIAGGLTGWDLHPDVHCLSAEYRCTEDIAGKNLLHALTIHQVFYC